MSKLNNGPYHDGYANLAAAIIADGVKHNDITFLKSNWCDILKEICRLDDEMYGRRDLQMCSIITK